MLRILTKLSLSGGALAGTFFVGRPLIVSLNQKEETSEKHERILDSIESFEDISIYAKQNGCSFVFSKSWDNKEVYSPEGFILAEQVKPTKFLEKTIEISDWKKKMASDVNHNKQNCKYGKTLTFFYYDDNRGTFSISEPPAPKNQ